MREVLFLVSEMIVRFWRIYLRLRKKAARSRKAMMMRAAIAMPASALIGKNEFVKRLMGRLIHLRL